MGDVVVVVDDEDADHDTPSRTRSGRRTSKRAPAGELAVDRATGPGDQPVDQGEPDPASHGAAGRLVE